MVEYPFEILNAKKYAGQNAEGNKEGRIGREEENEEENVE